MSSLTKVLRLAVIAALGVQLLPALPTMVRLGYPNCISCHLTPQGGGLLNNYGRGIDEAQSLRASEYEANTSRLFNVLSLGGLLDQDFRAVASTQITATTPNGPIQWINRSRFFYRDVTRLGKGFRISVVVDGETDPTMRKARAYDPAIRPGLVLVSSMMLQYRAREARNFSIEFGAGRDALPQGLLIPDQTTFIKARNRLGYYDTPTQAKAFLWGKRWLFSPFAFAPSYRESSLARESGGGFLAEYDLLGKGKTVVGVSELRGSDRIGNRTLSGIYTRLGFGSWGVLAEHDYTQRDLRQSFQGVRFDQQATYAQVFRYWREWLAGSIIVERLSVQQPYAESLWAFKTEVTARLTHNFTVSLRTGVQRDLRTGALSPVATIQLGLKTVN